MRICLYSARRYDRDAFQAANAAHDHTLVYVADALTLDSVNASHGCDAACVFVNDRVDAPVLAALKAQGIGLLCTRSTGYNQIDVAAARRLGLQLGRAANYSPYSVAEFAVGLVQAVNRHIARASARTRDGNFELDGLIGSDLHGKTVGVVGTGRIGRIFAGIMAGFGCELLGYDPFENDAFRAIGRYTTLADLLARSDVVSLHCPMTPENRHLIDAARLAGIKRGALLVNTSRGGLVDSEAAIVALKDGRLGGLGMDVYEQEAGLFFQDLSATVITDDVIERLLSFPNVIVTGHQAFFTREALAEIAAATLANATAYARGEPVPYPVPD